MLSPLRSIHAAASVLDRLEGRKVGSVLWLEVRDQLQKKLVAHQTPCHNDFHHKDVDLVVADLTGFPSSAVITVKSPAKGNQLPRRCFVQTSNISERILKLDHSHKRGHTERGGKKVGRERRSHSAKPVRRKDALFVGVKSLTNNACTNRLVEIMKDKENFSLMCGVNSDLIFQPLHMSPLELLTDSCPVSSDHCLSLASFLAKRLSASLSLFLWLGLRIDDI